MRVFIAAVNYAPEPTGIGPYATGLAEHLASVGHEVVVATSFPSFPLWRWYEAPARWRIQEHLNGVHVWRTKVLLPRRRTTFWRIAFDSSIAATTALTALSVPKCDLAICVSPPVQAPLICAALRSRVGKVVMFVQDLPVQAAVSVGMLRDGAVLKFGRSIERIAYQQADHIVVISPVFAESIRRAGVDPQRISEIPNWADGVSEQPLQTDLEVRHRLGATKDDFLVLHSGNMGAKQDLSNVVAAAGLLRDEARIKFALVGDGVRKSQIEHEIRGSGLLNIRLLPLQPVEEFPRVLAAADALLINQAPLVVDSVLPSKLLSYMASGRPVVAAVDARSTTADLVQRAGCGVVVLPGRPDDLARAITSIASKQLEAADWQAMGRRGRAYVEANFDRSRVLEKWDELLARLLPTETRYASG